MNAPESPMNVFSFMLKNNNTNSGSINQKFPVNAAYIMDRPIKSPFIPSIRLNAFSMTTNHAAVAMMLIT